MTPEGRIKEAVKTILRARQGTYFFMPVQNGMGAPSVDFLGCNAGRFFAIETKAPGKKPTKLQERTLELIRTSGGKCFIIDSAESASELMEWLI